MMVAAPLWASSFFAGFVILTFVVFGFIAEYQNLNEAAVERLARKTAVRDFCGAIRIRMNDIRMSANWWF